MGWVGVGGRVSSRGPSQRAREPNLSSVSHLPTSGKPCAGCAAASANSWPTAAAVATAAAAALLCASWLSGCCMAQLEAWPMEAAAEGVVEDSTRCAALEGEQGTELLAAGRR